MSVVAIHLLVQPIEGDAPCGDNLEYLGIHNLQALAAGKPERNIGDSTVPAEEPNWAEVKQQAIDLFARTKDLRVAGILTQALVRTDGMDGLSDGLEILSALLSQHWPCLYPRPEPDEPNDYTIRLNALSFLSDLQRLLNPLRRLQLVASVKHGRFSLRDIQLASGKLKAPQGENAPQPVAIESAFQESDIAALRSTLHGVERSLQHAKDIEEKWADRAASRDLDVAPLTGVLHEIRKELQSALASHPKATPDADADLGASEAERSLAGATPAFSGVMRSRQDVTRAIDSACDYLIKHEPSSPVPLLLKRAKRLMEKDFLQIIQDLAPDAMTQVTKISGTES